MVVDVDRGTAPPPKGISVPRSGRRVEGVVERGGLLVGLRAVTEKVQRNVLFSM